MIIILFLIVVALIVAVVTIRIDWNEGELGHKIWMCIWRPLFGILVGMVVGSLLAMFVGAFMKKKDVVKRTVPLYSINDFFGTDGQFFLGIGSVKTEPYYFFYKKTDGGFMLDKISTEKTVIIEQDSVQPRIEYLKKKFVNENNLLWGIPVGLFGCEDARIIVPKNSVKQNFNFDLQ